MADFAASLINPSTSSDALSCDGTNITIGDYSNYIASTESGHLLTNFQYKRLTVTLPSGSTYVFGTDYVDTQDEAINYPSTYVDPATYPPIETMYAYDGTDGVYQVDLLTIPTWSVAATYTTNDCVVAAFGTDYYIFKALKGSTGQNPFTQTAYWTNVTSSESSIPSRYKATAHIAVTCVIDECWADLVVQAGCQELNVVCDDEALCDNSTYRKAMRLSLIKDSIDVLVDASNWTQAQNLINSGINICNCCN